MYDESPFKSIISDIRSILPKKGFKELKDYLNYVEEKKELTSSEKEDLNDKLIKKKNDLTIEVKQNKRNKKADKE